MEIQFPRGEIQFLREKYSFRKEIQFPRQQQQFPRDLSISDLAVLDTPVVVLWDLLPPLLNHGDLPLVHVGEADLEALLAIVNPHRLKNGVCQMLFKQLK